jgi:uncharacterized protein YceK
MVLKYLLLASLVTIAGCSSFWTTNKSSQSAASGSTAPQPTKSASQPAKSSWMQTFAKTPAMDSSRKVNEQSCTAPVAMGGGNLRCK